MGNVNRLNFDALDETTNASDGLDGKTLIMWLQLAPNVKELDLEDVDIDDKMRLANELNELLETDQRVRTTLDQIEKIFRYNWYSSLFEDDDTVIENMDRAFDKIFPKTICSRQ